MEAKDDTSVVVVETRNLQNFGSPCLWNVSFGTTALMDKHY